MVKAKLLIYGGIVLSSLGSAIIAIGARRQGQIEGVTKTCNFIADLFEKSGETKCLEKTLDTARRP